MIVVTLYVQHDNQNCRQALLDLEELQKDYPHQTAVVDIDQDPDLKSTYNGKVPVAQIGPYRLQSPFTRQELQVALGAATDRDAHLGQVGDVSYVKRLERGRNLSSADKISFWLSKRYMWLINLFLLLYVGLPFLAPVLVHNGLMFPARAIYTIYSPLCHQLAFRSWFLFGEQPYYPRELAGIQGIGAYEQMIGGNPADLISARKFIGVEEVGFGQGQIGDKIALCERDIAIYGTLFLFGLIFTASGRKIKQIPWYAWIIIGIIPIGLDGGSQLPSLINAFPQWLPIRESTPVLRTLTGGLFGLMTGWYLFPMIEENMKETRKLLAGKMVIVPQLHKSK